MRTPPVRSAALALALAVVTTGCSTAAVPAAGGSDPVRGGTLRVLGAGDVDAVDPQLTYTTTGFGLQRALTRQLVSHPAVTDPEQVPAPVPDMAEELPVSDDGGRTWTATIREGVMWDAPDGPRQVTAEDVERGFERLCNPHQASGGSGYYVPLVRGLAQYCEGLAQVEPTAEAIRAHVESHDVPGIRTDGRTVVFELVAPASDFLSLLALPFASAAPVESLDALPGSPESRRAFVGNGPYRVASWTPDTSYVLERNPAWDPATDDVRAAHVDRIEVTLGSDEGPVQMQLEAGTADLSWDTTVPTTSIVTARGRADERLALMASGSAEPYLVINTRSPNEGGALADPRVRQALNWAVDKSHVVQVLGGEDVARPLGQVLPPGILGHEPHDPYATPDSAGDPERARALLAEAGYPDGLELVLPFRDAGKSPQIAATLQADLAEAGIRLRLRPLPGPELGALVTDPARGAAGEWDLAAPSWVPDWQGDAGRAFFVPLLDSRSRGEGSPNYGGYASAEVDALIDEALAATDREQAADAWARADRAAMADAAWVPIATGTTHRFRSARVGGWAWDLLSTNADYTNVWLQG